MGKRRKGQHSNGDSTFLTDVTSFGHETRNSKSHLCEDRVGQATAPNSRCRKIRLSKILHQPEDTLAVLDFWRDQHSPRWTSVICRALESIIVEDETTSKPFIIVGWILQKGLEKNWDWQNANGSFSIKSSCNML